jgi:hypothetical protein
MYYDVTVRQGERVLRSECYHLSLASAHETAVQWSLDYLNDYYGGWTSNVTYYLMSAWVTVVESTTVTLRIIAKRRIAC